MTTLETLILMRDTFKDKSKWTTGFYARDSDGRSCSPENPRAVCWCLDGLRMKLGDPGGFVHSALMEASHKVEEGYGYIALNDRIGYYGVMKALDIAIANASK